MDNRKVLDDIVVSRMGLKCDSIAILAEVFWREGDKIYTL